MPPEKTFKRTLVTAALPYANGALHIGHLAGAYMPADMWVRYKRLTGEHVLFICGSDEHGVSIPISADKEKVTPQEIIDRYHNMNKETFGKLGISFDYYARTSSPAHHTTAQEFFLQLHKNGYLVAKEEPQLYDEQAQMFLPDRYVEGTCPVCSNPDARGDQCENCGTYLNQTELINPRSKVTGNKPVIRATKHWYFALSRFQDILQKYADEKRVEWKDNVIQAVRSWLKMGLQDRPITRDLDWGIKVPLEGADGKVLYVWFDAPIGYISATKECFDITKNPHFPYAGTDEENWRTWWQNEDTRWLCFLGKDNIVFHTILFPAMLMAYNDGPSDGKFIIPDNVPGNEFMNLQGQKLSKSRGWVIEAHELAAKYPADIIRYTFAVTIPEQKDTDFTWKDFQAHTNNELADIVGNLVNRVLTFVKNNFDSRIPSTADEVASDALLVAFGERAKNIGDLYDRFKLREAAMETVDLARIANKYFNDNEPWKVIKTDREAAGRIMRVCLEAIRALSVYFAPIIPDACLKIQMMLNYTVHNELWFGAQVPKLPDGGPINQPEILFAKIEDEVVEAEVKALEEMSARVLAAQEAARPAPPKQDELISIDDFKKIKFRTARIIAAEKVAKSKKLVKLQVRLGPDEERQIVAGIAEKFSPEQLLGKMIVIVSNLKPTTLMGNESNGMLLAANDENGPVALITTDILAEEGLEVR
jgi:methionyl-tRNA synthetase